MLAEVRAEIPAGTPVPRVALSRESFWTSICTYSLRETQKSLKPSFVKSGPGRLKSMNPRNLLVTTDFSFQARRTYHCAAALAKKFDAALHVCHVEDTLPPLFSEIPAEDYLAELKDAVHREVENADFDGLPVVPHLLQNRHAFEALNVFARAEGIDLIVMSTHGRTGVQRFLLGSFAERVVRTSTIPVLVHRQKDARPGGTDPKTVLVPFDFSEESTAALPALRVLSAAYGCHFTILYVHEPVPDHVPFFARLREMLHGAQSAVEEQFVELKEKELAGIDATLETCEGVPYLEIARTAREIDADLVVLSTHGVLGSVAQNVIRDAPCSVLSLRPGVG